MKFIKNQAINTPWLDANTKLPSPESAQKSDEHMAGLVAAGGGLSVSRLREAYQKGIFPWFSEGQPVLWWSPNPRMVLETQNFKLHRSLRKTLENFVANPKCTIQIDSAFQNVINHCANSQRKGQSGTWIVDEMIQAYISLHEAGFAHSVETWINGALVGGLYFVSIGNTIFGESMFAHQTDASKIALSALSALVACAKAKRLNWIDCQQNTKHLASLGAYEMPRTKFLKWVELGATQTQQVWTFEHAYWEHLLPSKASS